ncbi:cAMP-dependent protein kinase type 2 [Biomphalaria pfeifferi]|uniref:cAMP-dependent protein kinase type 2 n=1 Tax=Biomphalaria pfeifferi TaxID=112525 RepID=A0AAD8FBX2_BIOPF|nr:cAMP-dependent protein kinase type 2 [Biomphalaria pfeifferi]
MMNCQPDCTKPVASDTSSKASTSQDSRRTSMQEKLSVISQPGDPEYYQFLDSEMAVREISGNSKRLYDYRYFNKVARFSVDGEMSLSGREYHMVEQVYYNTFPKHVPMIWKTYDPESFQVLKKDFARGTSGKIELVVHKRSKYLGVLKSLPLSKITEARTEFNILNQCRECPFVINVLDGFESTKLRFRDYSHFILMEFAPFLTLDHLTHAMKGVGSSNARLFCMEVTMALEYLHSKNILHRDVKPENIYILISGHVVLGDLGSAIQLDSSTLTLGRCATYVTRAPEIWNKEPYGKSADVWSLGVTVYNIISNQWPFVSPYQHIQIEKVNAGNVVYGSKFCKESSNFIAKMIVVDPKERTPCKELLKHPYFDSVKPPYDPPYSAVHYLHLYDKNVESDIIKDLLNKEGRDTQVTAI